MFARSWSTSKRLVQTLAFGGLALTSAAASEPIPDLKNAGPDRVIQALTYCRGTYSVTTIAGSTQTFKEFDVRLKTDASDKGPAQGRPVMIGTGGRGDRVNIVFASPAEISRLIRSGC